MSLVIFPYCRFHLFRWSRAYPIVFWLVVASAFVLVITSALWGFQTLGAVESESAILRLSQKQSTSSPSPDMGPVMQNELPEFNSAQFVATLNHLAELTAMPIDDVAFNLDDTANLPYLRYRVKLSTAAIYPVIRSFVDRLRGELSNVSLDAISCARPDIGEAELTCELALSAFYRKSPHG